MGGCLEFDSSNLINWKKTINKINRRLGYHDFSLIDSNYTGWSYKALRLFNWRFVKCLQSQTNQHLV